ncbi:unnamed protein product, partial [Effrenium voratum]
LLVQLGLVVRSRSCPASEGYTWCEVLQDVRSLLSFALGTILCCLLTRKDAVAIERPLFNAWLSIQL